MRILLDANLSSRRVGDPLRSGRHDVRGVAGEAAMEGLDDDDSLLELATSDERILVTRNSRHFAPLCRAWAEAGREHAGFVLIWTLSTAQHGEIARAVAHRLEQRPSQHSWRGIVVAV